MYKRENFATCPYCNHKITCHDQTFNRGNDTARIECYNCNQVIDIERNVKIFYSASKVPSAKSSKFPPGTKVRIITENGAYSTEIGTVSNKRSDYYYVSVCFEDRQGSWLFRPENLERID